VNVGQIVTEWLVANGYDGLAGEECGCFVGDLMPCGLDNSGCARCVAGHRERIDEYDPPDCDVCVPGRAVTT
jgi:hypothetical protein